MADGSNASADRQSPHSAQGATVALEQHVADETFRNTDKNVAKPPPPVESRRGRRLRQGFVLITILGTLTILFSLDTSSEPHIFIKSVDHHQQQFGLCENYNVTFVNRSSGGDSNCFGIPSVLCGNVTCESVVQLVKPAVLCELQSNLFNVSQQHQECTPRKKVYTCAELNESTLPCSQDFVIEQFDYHTQLHCLQNIAKSIRSTTKVPPILHQVWFYDKVQDLEFHEYVAVLSHLRFLEAEILFIWNNGFIPKNKWWQELIAQHNQPSKSTETYLYQKVSGNFTRRVQLFKTKIYLVRRDPQLEIYGMPIAKVQHFSDVTRLEAMLMFGGFYADVDTISLRSHKPLMQHSITMSLEGPESLTNMAIFAEPQSPHLFLWHYSYASFDKNTWSEWSIQRNFRIARRCPHFMNKEPNGLERPDWYTRHLLATGEKNISESHTMHLYWRYIPHDNLTSPEGVLYGKFMGHRIFRGIYYGLCDICG